MTMELARVTLVDADGLVPVIVLEGELDHSNYARVGREIERLLPDRPGACVLDLGGTQYLDSSGVRLLFELRERLLARGQSLQVVAPPGSPVSRVLSISGIHALIPIHPSREDAAAASTA